MREAQLKRLHNIRATRDEARCVATLKALGEAARNGTGNLLGLSIEATRARATVGEISSALEGVYGRYQATIRSIAGVYAGEWEGDAGLDREVLEAFGLDGTTAPNLSRWNTINERIRNPEGDVTIAIVGKYTGMKDAYKSLTEALSHGGIAN